jgi:site-specific DNA recombinase
MTGIIYARYSSDNQREESIDGQIRECKEFAEKNDIRIIDTYIDRALSAKTDNRPSFQQMIKDSSKGLFDVIIVWKLDRFARNRYDSAHYKNILKKNGVKVVSATKAISSGAEGILLESMLEGYAEYYSAELAEKINRGLTENALKCKYNGGSVAFGYMIDDEQHFQINPTLAPVVLNIFNDYLSGKTQKEIRDELNNKGLKNANGREFTINNISKILTNRRYVGNYIYKDVVIENGIPAIVPNDVFDKVQEMIAVNKRAPSRHKAVDDYLLTTKLYCGKCKSFMVGESGNARDRRYSYYKCVNTKRNKTCDKKAVKKDWIEDIVIYQVMKFISDDSLVELLVNKILSIQGKESPMLKSLKKQLSQTDTAIENMLNAIEQGIITKSTKKRLDELESTKENLETEIAKENISHPLLTKEFLYSWFDGFKNFDVNKLENRKMLIDTFVNSVVLYDDRIDFYFNFKDNAKSLALSELNTVSDLSSSSPPKIKSTLVVLLYFCCGMQSKQP